MLDLATESAADGPVIEALLDAAFGADRQSKRSYAYRSGVAPVAELAWVVREAGPAGAPGRIVGSIRYWPVLAGGVRALLLGPLAVDPKRQGAGIGATLVYHTIDLAAWGRWPFVLLVGEPAYYRRFGFSPAAPQGLTMPGEQPHRLMVRALSAGALDGVAGEVLRWGGGTETRTRLSRADAAADPSPAPVPDRAARPPLRAEAPDAGPGRA